MSKHMSTPTVKQPANMTFFNKENGPDKAGITLKSVLFREALSSPFSCDLQLYLSQTLTPEAISQLLGTQATLTIDLDETHQRHINGYLTHIESFGYNRSGYLYALELRSSLWLLSHRIKSRIFTNKNVVEIIEHIHNEVGLPLKIEVSKQNYPKKNYCVQYRESDANFIQRLLEHAGIYYYFEQTASNHTLVICDQVDVNRRVKGSETLTLQPNHHGVKQTSNTLFYTRYKKSLKPLEYQIKEYDHRRSTTKVSAQSQTEHATPDQLLSQCLSISEYGAASLDPSETDNKRILERFANTQCQALRMDQSMITVGGVASGMSAGYAFLLEQIDGSATKLCLPVSTVHRIELNPLTTGSDQHYNVFVEADVMPIESSTVTYYPPLRTPRPRIDGCQSATVIDKNDSDATPGTVSMNEHGEVRVKFHWEDSDSRHNHRRWLRVAQMIAGKGWGSRFIPRVGQEVLVSFLDGDPDRPVIVGSVYNDKHTLATLETAPEHSNGFRSCSLSTKGSSPNEYNELSFSDEKGKELLHMHAAKKFETTVEKDYTVTAKNSIVFKAGDSTIILKKNGSIILKGKRIMLN